jgi:D-alanyl-D-alanine dipeptidase
MKTVKILTLSLMLCTACQSNNLQTTVENQENIKEKKSIIIPIESQQLIMVVTPSWNERNGKLQRYQKDKHSKWIKVGKSIDIILGRNGLGWGLGLHAIPKNAKYIKKEGDGKAPAGLFSLGNGFGYQEFKIDFPYQNYKRTDHCVDDSKSQFYNTIVDSKKIKKDYKSFEHMRLKNNLYRYGITVNHNPNNIAQGGSCIFIHIKNNTGKGTAGCTAMKESEIIDILKWLQEKKRPLLLQLPEKEIKNVKINM